MTWLGWNFVVAGWIAAIWAWSSLPWHGLGGAVGWMIGASLYHLWLKPWWLER